MHLLKHHWPRLARTAFLNRMEILRSGWDRRMLFKAGLIGGAGYLVDKKGLSAWASGGCDDGECELGCSPPTIPFVDPLPIPPILPERTLADPGFAQAPTTNPNRAINPATSMPYEGRLLPHQFRSRFPPEKHYVTRMRPNPNHQFSANATNLSRIGPQNVWGFNLGDASPSDAATFPGPTIVSRYGEPILVRRYNELVADGSGFGVPEVSTHLHNFHSGPDSDGGPCDPATGGLSLNPLTQGRFFFSGQYYDYFYTMARAGFDTPQHTATDGDIRETLGTLWYHDHRVDHTAENVYKGLAGFHVVFNDHDTGDENTGFRLPSFPDFDIPLFITDKLFTPEGEICFDLFGLDGLVGDKMTVNGKFQPYLEVGRRRYRFRILVGGPSRFMELYLTNPSNPTQRIKFWAITSSDGNLLESPIELEKIRLSVAERVDIIIDFDEIAETYGATTLHLENRLEQKNGRGPTNTVFSAGAGDQLLQFRLLGPVADDSVHPRDLATQAQQTGIPAFAPIVLPVLPTDNALATEDRVRITRTFDFNRTQGQWAINNQFVDCSQFRFAVERNTAERWIFRNSSGGWQHPIHVHMEEFRMIRRNGVAIQPGSVEYGRKDVVRLGFNEEIEVLFRFRDFTGGYPMHCHNTIHEDHAMMLLFELAATGDNRTQP